MRTVFIKNRDFIGIVVKACAGILCGIEYDEIEVFAYQFLAGILRFVVGF